MKILYVNPCGATDLSLLLERSGASVSVVPPTYLITADICGYDAFVFDEFQSTSPYAGDDPMYQSLGQHPKYFNPRPQYHTPSISSQESPSRLFTVIL